MTASPSSWPKVDHELNWAPYPGWTILYDSEDGRPFDTTRRDVPTPLTKVTGQLVSTLAATRSSGVAVLPISTHHITVCDGVDPAMFARSSRRRHHRSLRSGKIERFPSELGASIRALFEATGNMLELEVSGVELRNTAIVVRLEPAPSSAPDFARICTVRAAVLDTLGGLLGLELMRPWRPHATLGYLTDRSAHESARSVIDELDRQASRITDVLRPRGASLYQFASMVDFHRHPEPRVEQP